MINNKLVGYRNRLGLTQTEMATKIGIGLTSYNFKEQGKKDFKQSEMEAITTLIKQDIPDITMDKIFFRDIVVNLKTNSI
ncbi:MAG: transcriptional regulator [Clostridiaceae bacterium]|nr:transcriptional regulator [Clostridiaceae bacterium]